MENLVGIRSGKVEYYDGDHCLQAHVAWDDATNDPRPGVLVAHAWQGRCEFEEGKAERLAELGYVGFALDMYGKGIRGTNPDENRALMLPLLDDRRTLQRRMGLALAMIAVVVLDFATSYSRQDASARAVRQREIDSIELLSSWLHLL